MCLACHVARAPLLWSTSDSDLSHSIRVPSRSRTPAPQLCDSTSSLRRNILRTGSSEMRASQSPSWSYPSLPPPTVHISCPGCCSLVVFVVLCTAAGGAVRQFPPPMRLSIVSLCPSVLGGYVSASWGRTGTSSVSGVRHSSPDPFSAIISLICFRVSSFCSVSAGGVLSVVAVFAFGSGTPR